MNSSMEQKQAPSEYQANLEMLMQTPVFSRLSLEPLKLLAYFCKREVFKAGEIIFRQEEPDANAYIIIEGKARLVRESTEEETVGEFGENDLIGGMTLFYEMKRLFTLKAETKVSCLMLSRDRFQKTLEQFPEIAHKMFEAIVRNVYEWESRFVSDHGLKCAQCRGMLGVSLL